MKTFITIIVCVLYFVLGMKLAEWVGNDGQGKIIKVLVIILLILFAIWNEGGFN